MSTSPSTKPVPVSFLVSEPQAFFAFIDKDHDNRINPSELRDALASTNIPVTQRLIDSIFNECDIDHDSYISKEEFTTFCQLQDQRLRTIFDSMDHNNNGFIEKKDLHRSLKSFDYHLQDEEIDNLINKIDSNKDKKITYTEFIQFYHLIPVNNIRNAFNFWIKDVPVFDDLTVVPSQSKSYPPSTIMIAGGVAGAVSRTVTAPLDRLQIILQVSHGNLGLTKSFLNIYQQDGLKAYFKGNGTNVVKIIPETAIKFLLFDHLKKMTSGFSANQTLNQLISGAIAGFTSQTLVYPFSSVKTRLALAEKSLYKGMIDCGLKMVKYEGAKSLFKGWTASSIGVVPYAAIDLALFNLLKEKYIKQVGKDPSSLIILCVGGMSGIVAQTTTYPLALVRTRLQSQGMPGREQMYDGLLDCFRKTIQKEGMLGLYRGLVPSMMKSVPAISLSYGVYEKITRLLHQ